MGGDMSTFAEGRVFFEGETFLKLHLGFGGVAGVTDFESAAAGPRNGEGQQFVEPTDLAFFEVLMESVEEGCGLGFFYGGEASEGPGDAGGDGGLIKGGELQFRQGGMDEVYAGDELFQPVIQQRQVERSGAVSFGEAASAGGGIKVTLLGFLLDDEIVIAHQFHGGDAFVFGIEEVLHGGAQMLGKHFGDPPGLHGGGEAEQGQRSGAARGRFAQTGGNEKGSVLDHAFAHELALPLFG